ncbi:MAG: hypothetical protein EXR69_03420 [Myxococcales bacterium]|nr:hypothetical protein [Myxococcales bacterium]
MRPSPLLAIPLMVLVGCRSDNKLIEADSDPIACFTDTWYADADGDNAGSPGAMVEACDQPEGYVADGTDCDDTDAAVNPAALEICNEIDDNCDGRTDEDLGTVWYQDSDSDTYGDPETTTIACTQPAGWVADNEDCDDAAAAIHPGAVEICDGLDNDCDGLVDDADPDLDSSGEATGWADVDGDGYGDPNSPLAACFPDDNWADNPDDCDDTDPAQYPGAIVDLLNVRACIDGSDWFVIQGSAGWWEHRNFDRVGEHSGCPSAETLLDGVAWIPTWASATVSDRYDPLPKTLPGYDTTLQITIIEARGSVTVTEQPTSTNGWTGRVLLDDDATGGPAMYEFLIQYAACPA